MTGLGRKTLRLGCLACRRGHRPGAPRWSWSGGGWGPGAPGGLMDVDSILVRSGRRAKWLRLLPNSTTNLYLRNSAYRWRWQPDPPTRPTDRTHRLEVRVCRLTLTKITRITRIPKGRCVSPRGYANNTNYTLHWPLVLYSIEKNKSQHLSRVLERFYITPRTHARAWRRAPRGISLVFFCNGKRWQRQMMGTRARPTPHYRRCSDPALSEIGPRVSIPDPSPGN